jgi:hypothetical protein
MPASAKNTRARTVAPSAVCTASQRLSYSSSSKCVMRRSSRWLATCSSMPSIMPAGSGTSTG